MIRWCAYCQRFQGEFPPFANTTFTHGICEPCAATDLEWTTEQERTIEYLSDLNRRFWITGRKADDQELKLLTTEALKAGVRAIDMLFAFAGPALVKVGELWAANVLTVADEHSYTTAINRLVDLLSQQILSQRLDKSLKFSDANVLIANINENEHGLGARFVNLALAGLGIKSEMLISGANRYQIIEKIIDGKFKAVGLSISMQSQENDLRFVVDALLAEPAFHGKIVIGGCAVNEGMIRDFASERVRLLARPKFDESDLKLFVE